MKQKQKNEISGVIKMPRLDLKVGDVVRIPDPEDPDNEDKYEEYKVIKANTTYEKDNEVVFTAPIKPISKEQNQ